MARSTYRSRLGMVNSKHLVRHQGRAILVYVKPIPGLHSEVSEQVIHLAAARAVRKGWKKVILTWADMPGSVCFEDGYVYVLALNPAMAARDDCNYEIRHEICRMDDCGEVFVDPEPHPPGLYDDWLYDF